MTKHEKLAAGWKPQRHRWHYLRHGKDAGTVICLRPGCDAIRKRQNDGSVTPLIQTCLLKAPKRRAAG